MKKRFSKYSQIRLGVITPNLTLSGQSYVKILKKSRLYVPLISCKEI